MSQDKAIAAALEALKSCQHKDGDECPMYDGAKVAEAIALLSNIAREPVEQAHDHYPLSEYQPDQWWMKELHNFRNGYVITDDFKRAVGVAINFANAVFASPPPAPSMPEVVAWMIEFDDPTENDVTLDPNVAEAWRRVHDNPYEITELTRCAKPKELEQGRDDE